MCSLFFQRMTYTPCMGEVYWQRHHDPFYCYISMINISLGFQQKEHRVLGSDLWTVLKQWWIIHPQSDLNHLVNDNVVSFPPNLGERTDDSTTVCHSETAAAALPSCVLAFSLREISVGAQPLLKWSVLTSLTAPPQHFLCGFFINTANQWKDAVHAL